MAPHDKRTDDRQNLPDDEHPPSQFHAVPPHLPPETYSYLISALLSLQGAPSHPHPLAYPYPTHPSQGLPNYNYQWPPPAPPGPSSFYPPPLPVLPQGTSAPPPVASTSTAPTAQDQETSEFIVEDKRRRNTAASGEVQHLRQVVISNRTGLAARFRANKKVKTLNLERTVADLSGRTDELEREATDLRRENAWLKEIVLLKGRNLAQASSSNQQDKDEHGDESDSDSAAKRRDKGKGKDRDS